MLAKNSDEEPVPMIPATGNVCCTQCGRAIGTYYFGVLKAKQDTTSVANVGHFCNQECKSKYYGTSRVQKNKRNGTRSKAKNK